MEFRLLRADEIDARVATVKENGLTILLYKDARCDMSILDETVGAMNWMRSHARDNANCIVSIWDDDKKQWISKEDTGTESFTEKEKGLASDSFKRACFNWGIGRELYTAPFMWIPSTDANIVRRGDGFTCYDRFTVDDIAYEGRRIAYVKVTDTNTRKSKEFGKRPGAGKAIGSTKAKALEKMLKAKNVDIPRVLDQYGVEDLADLTEAQHNSLVYRLEKA